MRYFNIIIVLLMLSSCGGEHKDDCITKLGKVVSEQRDVIPFDKLYVEDRIKVFLVQDSINYGRIELNGPSNLLNQIESTVTDNQLRLINTNTCNFIRSFNYDINVYVYVKELTEIHLESIAEVVSNDTININFLNIFHPALSDINLILSGDEVFIRSRNSASTILRGNLRVLKGSVEEISNLDAQYLVCEEVYIDTHSPLDCYINATKGMYLKILNSGNIFYINEPTDYKILAEQTGSGQLLKK
ncbi:MAG: DUF2807 domain-containing protein [Bacteroidia bacterium]|nr:DUF2807 domain-containing protein [Bacteroidia bacterium]